MLPSNPILARLSRIPAPAILALSYSTLIVIGSIVLWLPVSTVERVSLADALFTSASAVTVTGLVVIDPGSSFTFFGQAVIAFLIECGGLGLMTFATLVFSALGIQVGLPHRYILREDLNQTSIASLPRLVKTVLKVSFAFQATGAIVLAFVFVPEFGWTQGLWHAVFHAISAFNNAGFALFPDSLSQWVGHPVVNLAVPILFIVGGIGFIVLEDIWRQRGWRRLTAHSKITLAGTAILVALPFLFFAVLEWRNPQTLAQLPTGDKLWASWFQAVTPRTAGFNTIPTAGMHDATTLMTMTLMLIGGGSTSTAGGIKVTTFFVLVLATVAFFRRRSTPHVFSRSIEAEDILKVLALVTISSLVIFTGIFLASVSHDGEFLNLSFEVVSAFGTTGLSRGATADLDPIGRTIIILMMFLGRVGPLTLGFFLATRSAPRVRYPNGRIYLG